MTTGMLFMATNYCYYLVVQALRMLALKNIQNSIGVNAQDVVSTTVNTNPLLDDR